MATQTCPKCKQDSFTWSIDEEESGLTKWGCFNCSYIAFEDESLERACSNCHKKTESRLEDDSKKYWWCTSCNKVTNIQ
jgi:hypothetical protein